MLDQEGIFSHVEHGKDECGQSSLIASLRVGSIEVVCPENKPLPILAIGLGRIPSCVFPCVMSTRGVHRVGEYYGTVSDFKKKLTSDQIIKKIPESRPQEKTGSGSELISI